MLTKEERDRIVEEVKQAIQTHNGPIARDTVEAYARQLGKFIEEESDSLLAGEFDSSNPQLSTHLDTVSEHINTFSQIIEALLEESAKVDIPADRILQNKKILADLSNSFNEVRNRVVEDKATAENIAKIKLQIDDEQKKLEKQEADARQQDSLYKELQQALEHAQAKVSEREASSKKLESEISQTKLQIAQKNEALAQDNPLTRELELLAAELQSLTEKVSGLEKHRVDQEAAKKSLADHIVSAKAQVSTLDSASSAAEAENARLADEERQLLLKQEGMKKASAESEHKKAQIQTKITSLKQEIGLLTSPEGQKETVEDLEAAERALQEKLKAAKEQGQASSQAKNALRDRSEDLQKQLAAQEAAEAAQKQETTLLAEQVSSLEEKAKQLKGRLESLKAEKALKEEEAKSRAQACSSDELQADSLQTEVDTLKARLQDAEVKTSSASAANLGLAKSIESLNSDLNSKLLSLQQAEEEVSKQHLRVEELKAKIEEADKKLSAGASPEPKSHELETLEKTLREKQADLDQITQGKTSQSTVIQTLRSQIIDIEKQILEARNVAATEITSLNDRLARLKQELLACNEQSRESSAELATLEAELKDLQQKHLLANSEALNKQSEKNSLKMTIGSLREQIQNAESGTSHDLELENLLTEKEKLESKCSKLQETLDKQTSSRKAGLKSSIQDLKIRKRELEQEISDAVESIEVTPSVRAKLARIRALIEQLDQADNGEDEEEGTNRELGMARPNKIAQGPDFGGSNQSQERGTSILNPDITQQFDEKIVCCPCISPINACWTGLLRSLGYGNN